MNKFKGNENAVRTWENDLMEGKRGRGRSFCSILGNATWASGLVVRLIDD